MKWFVPIARYFLSETSLLVRFVLGFTYATLHDSLTDILSDTLIPDLHVIAILHELS